MTDREFIVTYVDEKGSRKTEHVYAATAQDVVDLIRKWYGNDISIRAVYKEVRNWK